MNEWFENLPSFIDPDAQKLYELAKEYSTRCDFYDSFLPGFFHTISKEWIPSRECMGQSARNAFNVRKEIECKANAIGRSWKDVQAVLRNVREFK